MNIRKSAGILFVLLGCLFSLNVLAREAPYPIEDDLGSLIERRLLGFTKKGDFLLQDFYLTGEKHSDSFVRTSLSTLITVNLFTRPCDLSTGLSVLWHKNGKKCAEKSLSEDGREIYTEWYPSGLKKSLYISSSNIYSYDYTKKSWYENGQLKEEDGDGKRGTWNKAGQKTSESLYQANKDIYRFWHDNGQLNSEKIKEKDSGIEFVAQWDEKGNKLFSYRVILGKGRTYEPLVTRKILRKMNKGAMVQDFWENGDKATEPFFITNDWGLDKQVVFANDTFCNIRGAEGVPDISGSFISYNKNGQKKCEIRVEDADNHKIRTQWDDSGQLLYQSNYQQGVTSYVSWSKEGSIVRRMAFGKNGLGLNFNWYKNGQLKSILVLGNSDETHIFWSWYENGQLSSFYISPYIGSRQPKVLFSWNENGIQLIERIPVDGKANSFINRSWYDNGSLKNEIYNVDGVLESLERSIDPKTFLLVKEGHADFYKGGIRTVSAEVDTVNNLLAVVVYYENGQIALTGQYRLYRPSYTLKNIEYNLQQREGQWNYFYEDGKPQMQGEFLEGEQVGTWNYWDKEDNKTTEQK